MSPEHRVVDRMEFHFPRNCQRLGIRFFLSTATAGLFSSFMLPRTIGRHWSVPSAASKPISAGSTLTIKVVVAGFCDEGVTDRSRNPEFGFDRSPTAAGNTTLFWTKA